MIGRQLDFSGKKKLVVTQDDDLEMLRGEFNHAADVFANLAVLNPIMLGITNILVPGASIPAPSDQTFTATIPHNLGYPPLFRVYSYSLVDPGTGAPPIPTYAQVFGSPPMPFPSVGPFLFYVEDEWAYTDAVNLYINHRYWNHGFGSVDLNPPLDNIQYIYYLFSNPAATG